MVNHQSLKIGVCLAFLIPGIGMMIGRAVTYYPTFWYGLSLVIIGLLLALIFWPIHFIWPGKESWKGQLLESSPFLYGKLSDNWRTDRPQQVGDTFLLVIEKAPNVFVSAFRRFTYKLFKKASLLDIGRARVIEHIQFMRNENYPAVEFPKKYAVTVQALHSILPNWDRKELIESSPVSNIIIDLECPTKVTCIAINIVEPRPNHHWAVGEIIIREVRLFEKFWRVNIR